MMFANMAQLNYISKSLIELNYVSEMIYNVIYSNFNTFFISCASVDNPKFYLLLSTRSCSPLLSARKGIYKLNEKIKRATDIILRNNNVRQNTFFVVRL